MPPRTLGSVRRVVVGGVAPWLFGQAILAKAAALCLTWPARSSWMGWAISRAPRGNRVKRASRPTPVIRMATSTSTRVMPGRRVTVASPLLLASQPGAPRIQRERVGVGPADIDREGTDPPGAREDGDQCLFGGGG